MASFLATYTTSRGQTKELQVSAADLATARRDLRKRGIVPTTLQPVGSAGPASRGAAKAKATAAPTRSTPTVKFIASYVGRDGKPRELKLAVADMASARSELRRRGITPTKVVQDLGNAVFKRSLKAISLEVSQGETLGTAMRKWPKVFDRLSIALIEAGEVGGVLDESLKRLSLLLEQTSRLQNQVKGALGYRWRCW
jgi:type IV pilus assembly protein PilC